MENKATIMLLGKTGCGKSSLGNHILGEEKFIVSDINSETKIFEFKEGEAVNLIDSKGYELQDIKEEYVEKVISEIQKMEKENKTPITAIWYCISIAGKRIEPIDLLLIEEIKNNKKLKNKLMVVLTKADEDTKNSSIEKEFKETLKKHIEEEKIYSISIKLEIEETDYEKLIKDTLEKKEENSNFYNEYLEKFKSEEIDEETLYKGKKKAKKLGGLADEFLLLIDMVKDTLSGNFKLTTMELTIIIGAIAYVVSPIDAIPDVFLGIGFVDDIAVITMVLSQVKSAIDRYKEGL